MSAWAAENGLVLGELATDEKSNEITAIPQLLKMLELSGCIVTIDAMGTQKEIAKTIYEAKADYILTVKENQPGLMEDISLYFETEKADMTAAELMKAKRMHWFVENSLHWVLDVDFGEDHQRMRTGFAAENMNILRHLTLNLLKSEPSYSASINLKRKKCLLSPSYLLKVFSLS